MKNLVLPLTLIIISYCSEVYSAPNPNCPTCPFATFYLHDTIFNDGGSLTGSFSLDSAGNAYDINLLASADGSFSNEIVFDQGASFGISNSDSQSAYSLIGFRATALSTNDPQNYVELVFQGGDLSFATTDGVQLVTGNLDVQYFPEDEINPPIGTGITIYTLSGSYQGQNPLEVYYGEHEIEPLRLITAGSLELTPVPTPTALSVFISAIFALTTLYRTRHRTQ